MKAIGALSFILVCFGCGSNNADTLNNTAAQYSYRFSEVSGAFTCDTGMVVATNLDGYCSNLKSDTVNTDKSTGQVCARGQRADKFKEACTCWLRKLFPADQTQFGCLTTCLDAPHFGRQK